MQLRNKNAKKHHKFENVLVPGTALAVKLVAVFCNTTEKTINFAYILLLFSFSAKFTSSGTKAFFFLIPGYY